MASPNVSFDTIPASIRKPGKYFEFNTRLAVRTLPANEQRVVILAGKTEAGALAPLSLVDIFSDVEASDFAGAGSLGHLMCRAAIRAYPYIRLQLLVVEDAAAGLAANGFLALIGEATSAGTLSLSIGAEVYRVAAARGDTPQTLAEGLAPLINTGALCPVTATVEDGTLTLTAKNKGETGNSITLAVTESVPGITATVTAMSGGEVNPDLTDALAAIFAEGHNIVISPYTDAANLAALREHLDPLRIWGDDHFECIFRSFAPAHTLIHFAYGNV